MEIYTLVSLSIGIFGASYAALNALRINLEVDLREVCNISREKLQAVQKINGTSHKRSGHCATHHANIVWWRKIWDRAQMIPAAIFFVFMFFIAGWVLWSWEEVTKQHQAADLLLLQGKWPWTWFRGSLCIMALIDLTVVFLSLLALIKCRTNGKSIAEHHDTLEVPEFQDPAQGTSAASA
ncbi:MAG TPA: hypothetical protein DDZ88_01890 [Verrucomicrobiales bacterium]|nr:hypothetical protein [Verrucomicrobiales bacterium]